MNLETLKFALMGMRYGFDLPTEGKLSRQSYDYFENGEYKEVSRKELERAYADLEKTIEGIEQAKTHYVAIPVEKSFKPSVAV